MKLARLKGNSGSQISCLCVAEKMTKIFQVILVGLETMTFYLK